MTERKRAEEAAHNSLRLLQNTMEQFPTLVAFKDREGRVLDVNPAVERALEQPKDKILGRTIYDFIPKAAVDVLSQREVGVMESRRAVQVEEVTPLPGGTLYHLNTNSR